MAAKTTFQDQLLEEILGDVVKVGQTVEAIQAALPSLKQGLETVAAGAGDKLAEAVEKSALEAQKAARLAASDAMREGWRRTG
jgi:uncharacterized coiled-coil protein SlyX